MGIFDNITSAIFGSAKAKEPSPAASAGASPGATAAPAETTTGAAAPAPAAPAPLSQVDVEAVLTNLATQKKQKLDWRKSIVDLMKLLDLDSSLSARKELAKELNYTAT